VRWPRALRRSWSWREVRPDVLCRRRGGPKTQLVERIVEKPVEVVREVVREVPSATGPAQFVAVFQRDEQSPAFLMSVDIDKRSVTVRQGRCRADGGQVLPALDRHAARHPRRNRSVYSARTTTP